MKPIIAEALAHYRKVCVEGEEAARHTAAAYRKAIDIAERAKVDALIIRQREADALAVLSRQQARIIEIDRELGQ